VPWLAPAAVGGALVAATAAAVVVVLSRGGPAAPEPPPEPSEARVWAAAPAEAPEAPLLRGVPPLERESVSPLADALRPGSVRGFVLRSGRSPAAGALVVARRLSDGRVGDVAARATADPQGGFALAGLTPGPYRVEASLAGVGRGEIVTRAARDPAADVVWLDRPEAPSTITVRVVDGRGRPVEDALVRLGESEWQATAAARTDGDGVARLGLAPDTPQEEALVFASAPAGVARRPVRIGTREETVELVLVAPGRIEGRVDGPASPLGIALWTTTADGTRQRVLATSGTASGLRFGFPNVVPGRYALDVGGESGHPLHSGLVLQVGGYADGRPLLVDVHPGQTTQVEARLVEGAPIRGLARDATTGRPLAGAEVRLRRTDGGPASDPRTLLRARTDATGAYAFAGLPRGSAWDVLVVPWDPGVSFEHRRAVAGDEMRHDLGRAGFFSAAREPATRFGLRPAGSSETPVDLAGLHVAGDLVSGVPPGPWELVVLASRPEETLAVARFEVRAGETTRVPVVGGAEVTVAARVMRGGAPLDGAFVSALGLPFRPAGADGRVEVRAQLPLRMLVRTLVRVPEEDGVELALLTSCMAHGERIAHDVAVPAGVLTATVRDDGGAPVAGAELVLVPETWLGLQPVGLLARRTDARGTARWSALPAGRYAVRAGSREALARAELASDDAVAAVELVLER
jgi:hypothetical protein